MALPGMLYVTMAPKPGLSLDQFHEWYNNEHGPTRLRLPAIFANGLRYQATDGLDPPFLAAYDVRDLALLNTATYLDLRANRSPREAETIGQVAVTRYFFREVLTQQAPGFVASEDLPVDDDTAAGRVLVSVELTLNTADAEAATALERWYEEEHFPQLARVPGWLRSRLYRTWGEDADTDAAKSAIRLFSLHEYARDNGLGGPEHTASMATPRCVNLLARYVAGKSRRTYGLFYIFGPAPRDLTSLAALPATRAFCSADKKTRTLPTVPAIHSFVTLPHDGLEIPYVLEGNPAADAPTIAFCNSLLTSLHMWDDLVALLRAARPQYRILRYDARGRHSLPPAAAVPATLPRLADDLAALLAALRIPRLHALVGVSQGGATTLQFGLRHPELAGRLVACDFNVASSPANTQAWKDRIALAESDAGSGPGSGIHTLAPATVARWFDAYTLEHRPQVVAHMTAMVAANAIDGFRYGCQALWDYDMRAQAPTLKPTTLLVAGAGDGGKEGKLAKAMKGFRASIGPTGADFRIVAQAGHLPMYENPSAFWAAIEHFL
ncbi:alpha beta hydrolase fold family [Grosmannia clavigera kw1407]|uniref:Alpha beta hydrolase fold family n=1 Tax=Grosmannia clavigera (strain kw1407 / UAMH 11150) TaxID=655863 RepID=F0X764_GROCL|nr:alpha beta hydrolase fold family [Grosmannia clavigera kw1407]EFX06657.1 alpha beta hydrolase fold family [Grosmannia clavigera kw1407]